MTIVDVMNLFGRTIGFYFTDTELIYDDVSNNKICYHNLNFLVKGTRW